MGRGGIQPVEEVGKAERTSLCQIDTRLLGQLEVQKIFSSSLRKPIYRRKLDLSLVRSDVGRVLVVR